MLNHRFRYTSTSGAATEISSSGLIFAAGCVGTVLNSFVTSFYGSVRLNGVSIWTPPAAQGATATCSVEYYGQSQGNTVEYSDTTVSTAQPAVVRTRPPPQSLSAFWQTPDIANQQLVRIIAPTGSIIDVDLSLILYDDESAAQTRAVVAAALGTVYYLALDNATGSLYPPVSLTTTA